MKNALRPLCALVQITAIATATASAGEVNTVIVGQDETLTESDLLNGEFMGQAFKLAPATIFQVLAGGLVGPIVSSTEASPFSFGNSTVNLETGSNFSTLFGNEQSYISNISMNTHGNATIWNTNFIGPNAQLNMNGGFYAGSIYNGATINITSGNLIAGTRAYGGSVINATGGVLQSIDLIDGSMLHSTNASITNNFGVFGGSSATLVNTSVGIEAWVQGSTLSMTAGSVADGMFLQGAETVFDGVVVGNSLEMRAGNLTIIDTTIGDTFIMDYGTNVELISGHIGDHAYVIDSFGFQNGGTLTVRGGSVGNDLTLGHKATLEIYGGEFGNIRASSFGLTVNIYVTSASINGVELDLLMFDTVEIEERDNAMFEAILSDGSYFDLLLAKSGGIGEDSIAGNTHLTVTLVPAPSTLLLLSPLGLFARRQRIA